MLTPVHVSQTIFIKFNVEKIPLFNVYSYKVLKWYCAELSRCLSVWFMVLYV